MKLMYFITNKKSKRSRRSIPMRRVYADAIRCYITYLLVIAVILVAPIDNSLVAVTAGNETGEHVNLEEEVNEYQETDLPLLYGDDLFINDIGIKASVLQKNLSIVTSPQEDDDFNTFNETNEENVEEPVIEIETEITEIEEPSDVIEEAIIEEDEVIDYYYDEVTSSSSVKSSSGLTAEQIDKLLEGTDLYGIGEAVYNVEQTNGINSHFTISVASLESGFGSSPLAKSKNNIFGMYNCSFKSFDSCVKYFGELMNDYEINHNITMTAEGINPRYCELDSWSGKVVTLMNQYIREANELY